jgi:hypothetical protein
VEQVGLVVVVALLLAACGVWLVAHAGGVGAAAPSIVQSPWSGLDRVATPTTQVPDLGLTPARSRGRAIGKVLARIGSGLRTANRVVAVGTEAFVRGVSAGLVTTVSEIARDPVGALVGGADLVGELARDPVGFTRAQIDAAVDYVAMLRGMPADQAYQRLMHDLGEVTVDVVVLRGKAAARNALLRSLKRRIERDPAPKRHTN